MIRVLLVDDSPAFVRALGEVLVGFADVEVVGIASDARQAMELMTCAKPHVLCAGLDLASGVALTRQVMKEAPIPVLLLSGEGLEVAADLVEQAYGAEPWMF